MKDEGNLHNMHVMPWRYQELEYLLYASGLRVDGIYTDRMKRALEIFALIFLPGASMCARYKEIKADKKGSVDFRRINRILF